MAARKGTKRWREEGGEREVDLVVTLRVWQLAAVQGFATVQDLSPSSVLEEALGDWTMRQIRRNERWVWVEIDRLRRRASEWDPITEFINLASFNGGRYSDPIPTAIDTRCRSGMSTLRRGPDDLEEVLDGRLPLDRLPRFR